MENIDNVRAPKWDNYCICFMNLIKVVVIMKFKYHIVLLFALCFCLEMKSQTIAVKSNLLYDLTSSINAGIELGLAPKWTLDVTGSSMPGICRIIGVGSTGLYNPKCAIGYATVLVRIFLDFTCMAVNTTSVE